MAQLKQINQLPLLTPNDSTGVAIHHFDRQNSRKVHAVVFILKRKSSKRELKNIKNVDFYGVVSDTTGRVCGEIHHTLDTYHLFLSYN